MSYLSINNTNSSASNTTPFVRNNGPYKITDLIGKDHAANFTQLSGKKTALISGAGISGLAAAFELQGKGFEVVVVEKRDRFSRWNSINFNIEVQSFLRKFNLLEEFETSVGARIKDHQIVTFGKQSIQSIDISDVSKLQFEGPINNDPMRLKDLFKESGAYTAHLKDLQAFLTQRAAKVGIRVLSEAEIKIVNPLEKGRVSKVEVVQKNSPSLTLEPDLLFIAEGAHSASADQLGMANDATDVVNNACTGENWVFGILNYHGDQTFVLSMIITSQKTLQIGNAIFNAKSQTVNIGVTADENLNQDDIKSLILATAKKAFDYKGIVEAPEILETVKQPVRITNRVASLCSKGNVFRIGDSAGHSSPLAGLGATLCLTLVPCAVEQLLDGYDKGDDQLHDNFKTSSQAYVNKWIDKSVTIKNRLQEVYDKNQS